MARKPGPDAGVPPDSYERRKLIGFDPETWSALDLLARDRMATIQELADEAFTDLLRKHNRPTSLKDALKQSARQVPANDPDGPAGPTPRGMGAKGKRR